MSSRTVDVDVDADTERAYSSLFGVEFDWKRNRNAYAPGLDDVFCSGKYILGERCKALERDLEAYVTSPSSAQSTPALATPTTPTTTCVTVSNGTDALELLLRAEHIGAGDEVIVPALTFLASATPVLHVGARPVFADVDPVTLTIDADDVRRRYRQGVTRAVVVVSLFGRVSPALAELYAWATRVGIVVIEDGAQSMGATAADGSRSCSCTHSHHAFTSFFPTKPLGCFGDGGAVFTRQPGVARLLPALRHHGIDSVDSATVLGRNARLDEIQASLLACKLVMFPDAVSVRRARAASLCRRLAHLAPRVSVPDQCGGGDHGVFGVFCLLCESVDMAAAMCAQLRGQDIASKCYYTRCLCEYAVFDRHSGDDDDDGTVPAQTCDHTATRNVIGRLLALPMHAYLVEDDCEKIATAVQSALSAYDVQHLAYSS